MDEELYGLISGDIQDRTTWAERQSVWYMMRHDGIRRTNKPWPWAADLHYALTDEKIDKLKPFYRQQWFATERFCDFTAKNPQSSDVATRCAYWYDYKIKQCSNLEDQLTFMINFMLTYGHGLIKTVWNPGEKRVEYDAIDPLYLIVPVEVCDLADASRVCHVKHVSKWEYMNGAYSGKYNQDPAFIKRICGSREREEGSKQQRQRRTEGINISQDPSNIIIWEVYEKQADGDFKIHTISPALADEDIREPFTMPYKNGEEGRPELPITDFWFDRTEKGYYSARGVAEILCAHEASMNRMWNSKHDTMALYNQPMLSATKDFPNVANIRCFPGCILPFAVSPIQMGAPPISYDQEMANTRLIAEQRIAVPDFTLGSRVQGKAEQGSTPRSATEINAVMGQQGHVVDDRARDHRRQAAKLHRQSWQLLVQFDRDLGYIQDGIRKTIDRDMRDEIFSIRPNGSSDSWNLQLRQQKCVLRLQLYKGDPFINQGELRKSCLEMDEPGLVARLYQDPDKQQQDQAEKQMEEMPALELGFPITPDETDDDQAHIGIILQFLVRNTQIQKPPLDPAGPTMISQHLNAHMQRLQQMNPKAYGQVNNVLLHLSKTLNQGQSPVMNGQAQMQMNVAPQMPMAGGAQ